MSSSMWQPQSVNQATTEHMRGRMTVIEARDVPAAASGGGCSPRNDGRGGWWTAQIMREVDDGQSALRMTRTLRSAWFTTLLATVPRIRSSPP